MYSFKLIAFIVSAILVSELRAASFSGENKTLKSSSGESEERNKMTDSTEQRLTTVVDDITCISNCPSITQGTPVCGTNGVTYPSLDALECSQSCGVDVDLVSNAPCPTSGLQQHS